MAVLNKRYCVDDAVINYNYREPLAEDGIRRGIFDYLYNNTSLAANVDKMYKYKRIGRDSLCVAEDMSYLQAVAALFEIIKAESGCTTEDEFDEVEEEFKLDCIRDNLTCRFGKGELVNELIALLGIRSPNIGISYMTIQSPTAEADCSPFQPTNQNG